MKATILYFLLIVAGACSVDKTAGLSVSEPVQISTGAAGGAYFTTDNKGNKVLCWTEGEHGNEQLRYAVYDYQRHDFSNTITVPSKGINLSPETMNKVAFRNDGTVVAVFSRKHPTQSNKFAGSLMYSQSFDAGATWTEAKFVHTDTLPDNSRSYFDLATLPDGEVAVVWLDGRLKKGKQGSSVFFAKTSGADGFSSDKLLAETVCQCCRTDLYVDETGSVHVVYRDIEESLGGQIRDFVHIVSTDNGNSFSMPNKISNDNWVVDGCPHTGASMSSRKDVMQIVWFTGGGIPGLYFAESRNGGSAFQPRELVSQTGRHPQMAGMNDLTLTAWQEPASTIQNTSAHHGHHGDTSGEAALMLEVRMGKNRSIKKIHIAGAGEFPVVTALSETEGLIAYSALNRIMMRRIQ
jgi:hypothetical protein